VPTEKFAPPEKVCTYRKVYAYIKVGAYGKVGALLTVASSSFKNSLQELISILDH
jgi:hypothetical protein